jgi:glycosyltransferase involved in cell wall biosynthesis
MTRAITILSVNTTDVGGGAERVARELHESYAAAAEDAWFAVGIKRVAAERTVEIPNRARRSAWARAWMRAADALPQRGAGFRAARALRGAVAEPVRWIERERGREDFDFPGTCELTRVCPTPPDVVHLHNLHGGYFDLRELPALSRTQPVLLTMHDAWLLSGHCAHSFECGRWETGCGECPALWIHPAVPRDATAFNWERKRELFARSALHVAVSSRWMADRVRRSMLAPAVREMRVIPFGVNLDVFRPASGDTARAARVALGLDPARAVILVHENSLRPRTWKDSDAFRGALSLLGGAAASAQWIAIGAAGPDEHVGTVRLRRVPAQRDDHELARWYQAADLYVHPARAEAYGLMIVEALACGTPVIASDTGGIPELVGGESPADQTYGALFAVGDARALAARITEFVARSAGERAALSATVAHKAKSRFDTRRHERDYLDWIRELAARSVRTPSHDHHGGA